MASYLIYIPDTRSHGETLDRMREVGLGDLIDGASTSQILQHGPNDQGRGHLVHWDNAIHHDRNPKLVIDPEVIDWAESKTPGLFWMGQEHDRPVEPIDIARGEPVPHSGELVQLGDLQQWEVPIARQLPARPTLDENRQPVLVVVAQHQEFYDRAESYLQEMMGFDVDGKRELNIADGFRFAVDAIAMNYRLNSDIIDWLGLFATDAELFSVCNATIELQPIIEAQKKTTVS